MDSCFGIDRFGILQFRLQHSGRRDEDSPNEQRLCLSWPLGLSATDGTARGFPGSLQGFLSGMAEARTMVRPTAAIRDELFD
jgi:hypothetical protein